MTRRKGLDSEIRDTSIYQQRAPKLQVEGRSKDCFAKNGLGLRMQAEPYTISLAVQKQSGAKNQSGRTAPAVQANRKDAWCHQVQRPDSVRSCTSKGANVLINDHTLPRITGPRGSHGCMPLFLSGIPGFPHFPEPQMTGWFA